LLISGLLLVGVLCQWAAWRMRLPAILFLLLTGLVLGPLTGWLNPDELLGEALFPLVSLGVAVILFEGSLTLRFSEARGVARIIRNLASIGVFITAGILALAAHYLAGLSWAISMLFGALGSVTGPTVIVPMLRSMKPTARIGNILRWEGILVDAIGALLAVLVYEAIVSGRQTDSAVAFIKLIGAGAGLGMVGAFAIGTVLRKHWIPGYLINYFTLALVLMVFTLANAVEHESGLVAVTVMGITLANMRGVHVGEILDFKEHLTVLLISVLFLLLSARMEFGLIQAHLWPSLAVLAVAMGLARPLSVAVSSIGTSVNLKEAVLLAGIAPRGIVAAAVSSLFALRLMDQGLAEAEALVPLTFVLIVGTVVIQSAYSRMLADGLGLSSSGRQGVMILGANLVARSVAKALGDQEIDVLLVDDNWEEVRQARMQGLTVWFGNPLSENADLHLDRTGMNRLFLMARRPELNTLVYSRMRPEFGPDRIYRLDLATGEEDQPAVRRVAPELRAQNLFGHAASWRKLASQFGRGAQIRWTNLTESFDLEAFTEAQNGDTLLLFATDEEGRLRIYSDNQNPEVGAGWKIGSLSLAPMQRPAATDAPDGEARLPG
jgi:NhaP-type Na+/H+ or K+/H+ antiporter